MDDGHFGSLGVVLGGSIFLLTTIAGGLLFYFSRRAWREEKNKSTREEQ